MRHTGVMKIFIILCFFVNTDVGSYFDTKRRNPSSPHRVKNSVCTVIWRVATHLIIFNTNEISFININLIWLIKLSMCFITSKQKSLRLVNYLHLSDAVNNDVAPVNLGQLCILKSSFRGWHRYMPEMT